MLLLYSDGQLTKIVQEGDTTPIGTIFKGCGFGQPAINESGDVAFFACSETADGLFFGDGVYKYSQGQISTVVIGGDPSPIGGTFALSFVPAQAVQMNDNGDVLFQAGVILLDLLQERFGLFLVTQDGVKKIEVDGDPLPVGGVVTKNTFGFGDLNDRGDAVFTVSITGGPTDTAIFSYSQGTITKIIAQGDPTPLGGRFATLGGSSFIRPRINNNGAIAAQLPVVGGGASSAIFMASRKAIIKVVGRGDPLPTGGKIKDITTFALNDLGQVAFYAEVKNGPKGVFLATPPVPDINVVKLKQKPSGLKLIVKGNAMITNDTIVEINGVPLEATSYPESFRENGGTTRRVVSADPRLDQLLPQGQQVQITVFNPLTNLRSVPVSFTR
jgi:hypothetical protein